MRLLKTIRNVGSVRVIDQKCFLCSLDGNLYLDDKLIAKNVGAQSYWLVEEMLYFHSIDGEHIFLDLTTGHSIKGSYSVAWNSIHAGYALCSFGLNRVDRKWHWNTGSLVIASQHIELEFTSLRNVSLAYYVDNRLCVGYASKTSLGGYSLEKDCQIWEADLESFGLITHILGDWNHQLLLWTDSYHLIHLNLQTGQVIQQSQPLQFLLEQRRNRYVSFPILKADENSLLFFEQDFHVRVDLPNHRGELIWKQPGYNISLSVTESDYIYFIGGINQGLFKNGIGLFDRRRNEVCRLRTVELDDFVVLNQIQVAGNRIYVRDSEWVLRIFQNDANSEDLVWLNDMPITES